MLYDNAFDDGPMLVDNHPCLTMVTSLCEDTNNNALLAGCDDTLIQKSPISFLNSSNHTIEEKFALCKNYMHGLQLSYENSFCNHDNNAYVNSCNYF